MKRFLLYGISIILFFGLLGAKPSPSSYRIYDLHQGKETPMPEVISELKKNRIILVGEHHSNKNHHLAQLAVIQVLKDAGVQVAVGLEMFRSDSQKALDRWIAGEIDEKEFQAIYYDNWNFPWPTYSMIFDYARDNGVPMIGLNVPREITRQVSREGFKSLTDEQKGKLSNVSCRVDEEYMNYIKKAFGGHGHGNLNFTYFCEAQLVWDNVMAVNALDYLQKNPDAVVVILAGTGHARKGAVPRQIRNRSKVPYAVILPEVKGGIDPDTIDTKDADYIMLGL
jgi:uncharacterized iron-regulated protein